MSHHGTQRQHNTIQSNIGKLSTCANSGYQSLFSDFLNGFRPGFCHSSGLGFANTTPTGQTGGKNSRKHGRKYPQASGSFRQSVGKGWSSQPQKFLMLWMDRNHKVCMFDVDSGHPVASLQTIFPIFSEITAALCPEYSLDLWDRCSCEVAVGRKMLSVYVPLLKSLGFFMCSNQLKLWYSWARAFFSAAYRVEDKIDFWLRE